MEATKDMQKYFQELEKELSLAYSLATKARSKGYDPESYVDIPIVRNMAERIENLIAVVAPQIKNSGMIKRIEELEKKYGKLDWRVAFTIALEVAKQKFCKFNDEREAMEVGIRVAIAYLTLGIVSTPIEGFTRLELKNTRDGKKYFSLYFSGPIRSAGTTTVCASLAAADYVRKEFGYSPYDPTEQEVKRMVTEVYDFHERITNLQYLGSEAELIFLASNLPIQIDGDPSEELEVSNYKDLDRIKTNRVRSGACLVLSESLALKAVKLWKQLKGWSKDFGLEHWNFLEKFVEIQKQARAKEVEDTKIQKVKIKPDYAYIKDLVAGRPILTHPLRIGGFRLRYGRCRNTGLSSMGIHPATMIVLDNYIGIGTQLKVERPGKSTALSGCDEIEGPIVKLKNGDVVFLETEEEAKKYSKDVSKILFLGDLLINYGDFFNRAHILVPSGYCEEWWLQEIKKNNKNFKIEKNKLYNLSFDEALEISIKFKVPLHPRYTYHWNDITKEEFLRLANWLKDGTFEKDKITLPTTGLVENAKEVLEMLGIPHIVKEDKIIIEKDWARALTFSLGFLNSPFNIDKILKEVDKETVLEIVSSLAGIKIRDKSGTFIGARMGRPEKAKMRKLTGTPHVLFPIGEEGGRLRSFQSALEQARVIAEFPTFYCKNCNKNTIYPVCEICDKKTTKLYYCQYCNKFLETEECIKHKTELKSHQINELDIKHYFNAALGKLNLGPDEFPELIKGVRGTSNKDHTPENLIKGILRAIYELYVNKDGTIRYDMTELPITAFKPKEINVSIEKLKELGYTKDIYGNKLVNEEQVIELKPQDVILPACEESEDEGADEVLFRVANFIDELLVKFYKLNKFYNLKDKKDLIGHLIVAIAPHISAGVIGRIIGFSKTQGFYAHPMLHCACRRDADGDELSVILLMDVLLNFSRNYLPTHRGGSQDAPLILNSVINPSEVDDMLLDVDVVNEYPLEFYEVAMEYKFPWEVKIEQIRNRIGKEEQYEKLYFTHDTDDLNQGVRCSAYKALPTMEEKVFGQMELAEKIRAVDTEDVARLIIERHFIRDILGNLRKFSTQEFRCVKCNEKFRRPPLVGQCTKCEGRIIFTVSEGTVTKYLEPAMSLVRKYNLSPFLKQSLELTKRRIESIFGVDKEKQEGLGKWFG